VVQVAECEPIGNPLRRAPEGLRLVKPRCFRGRKLATGQLLEKLLSRTTSLDAAGKALTMWTERPHEISKILVEV
jgi:hypothetical protein